MMLGVQSSSSSSSMNGIIGEQYCMHDAPMELTLITKSFNPKDADIKDSSGENIVLKLRGMGAGRSSRGQTRDIKRRIVVMDANGDHVLASFKSKMFSQRGRFHVFRGDSTNMEDVIFSVRNSAYMQHKTRLDVFMAPNVEEIACDFKIKKRFSNDSCTIYKGNTENVIAEVREETTLKDGFLHRSKYRMFIYPRIDFAFISTLVAIVDQMMRRRRSD